MRGALLVILCNAVALLAADWAVSGIAVEPAWKALVAGAVLGLINAILKPVVMVLSLPLIILTLGVALFFINLGMLALAAWVTPGFTIDGFWPAVGGAIVIWVVNTLLYALVRPGGRSG